MVEQHSEKCRAPTRATLVPFPSIHPSDRELAIELGHEAYRKGQVGVIVLAAGMASRLGTNGPKGCFPITPVRKKTLFQCIGEKVRAAHAMYQAPIPIAFMTSPLNRDGVVAYFQQLSYFGLDRRHLDFFNQAVWPLSTEDGRPLLDVDGRPIEGPNGNGDLFRAFYGHPLHASWQRQGIRSVVILPIDNPLADPVDAELVGFHLLHTSTVTLRVGQATGIDEKVGAVVVDAGKIGIVEYADTPLFHDAPHRTINLGLYCMALPFFEEAARLPLPVHRVYKRVAISATASSMAEKRETFLFDAFSAANTMTLLPTDRSRYFAPLKRQEDIVDIHRALYQEARRRLEEVLGRAVPVDVDYELDPAFSYLNASARQRWRMRPLPPGPYVDVEE